MKDFLLVLIFGVSLNAVQSGANAVLKLDPLFHPSLLAERADAEKSGCKPCCRPETLAGSAELCSPDEQCTVMKFYLDYGNLKYALLFPVSTEKEILLCDSKNTCLYYYIVESKKYCIKQKVSNVTLNSFWIRCIPNNATNLGKVRLGSDQKQSSLLLQKWMFMYYGAELEAQVTDIDCFPVGDFGGFGQFYYFDQTKRIKDPSVFTPPPYCNKTNDVREDSKFQQRMFNSLFAAHK